jgi:hypothetical protein
VLYNADIFLIGQITWELEQEITYHHDHLLSDQILSLQEFLQDGYFVQRIDNPNKAPISP